MCEARAGELGHRKNEPAAAMADVLGWKDFPKGLRVLLHESSSSSSSSGIKSKLEQMEYSVSLFVDEKEAMEAVAGKEESFHVAIIEISAANSDGCFRFLESAKGLPTIMISDAECIETMIKCIALGAAEFLRKPVSEEKLKNIWQLVVHKAFNAGGAAISNSLKPIKETVSSMLHLNHDDDGDDDNGSSPGADRFPAPTTPQLERFGRSSPSDPSRICSSATKSVDETCNNSSAGEDEDPEREIIESHDPLQANEPLRRSKKRSKVDWTPELHRRFVQAVDQLGIDQAIPSKILELMRVEGLTRHNVASHLQKYRMRRRHVIPKDEGVRMSWQRHGNPPPMMAAAARGCHYRPIVPFTTPAAAAAGYPVWGHPHAAAVQSWPPAATYPPPWHPSVDHHWPWKSYTKMHADAWGCPVVPRGHYPAAPIPPHYSAPAQCGDHKIDGGLTEEMIDEVVREALTEPWRPLPLGLKPPSTESVLSELYCQGICKVPP